MSHIAVHIQNVSYNNPHNGCTANIEAVTAHIIAATAYMHSFEPTATVYEKIGKPFYSILEDLPKTTSSM